MAAKRNVELGFVEEKEIFLLKSRFFPSKVCGLPSWLSLNLLPSAEELTCRVCSKPTVFLLQYRSTHQILQKVSLSIENDMPQAIEQPSMDISAELSTETVSHHLQPLDRPLAQRDSDMASDNENDLPQAIEQPSMDSSAELLTETVCHHFQPPDRPSGRRDSDMKSANENDLPPGIDQQSMD
ncbi:uncharacterized protein LOC127837326 isoform X1 [Dreissena polymorpha]|uniref:uncharacterized protein LOC127837326 isoform X1 n=1 Tax=Dreissena polymorpha TaxID=45954 RepID=UPI0022643998|nr:uncharacterized protein LOC127837326 isoform X1 [Dreissena polymorpha]